MPLILTAGFIFFDQNALSAAGLTSPKPGWTWDELIGDLHSISVHESNNGLALADNLTFSLLKPLIAHSLDLADGKIRAADLAGELAWYAALAEKGGVAVPLAARGEDARALRNEWLQKFAADPKPVFWAGMSNSWDPRVELTRMADVSGRYLAVQTYGVVPFPRREDLPDSTPVFAECAAISAGSQHQHAAWVWLTFLSEHWHEMEEMAGLTRIPARQPVAEGLPGWQENPLREAWVYAVEHWYDGAKYAETEELVLAAVAESVRGEVTLEQGLLEADSKAAPRAAEAGDLRPVAVAPLDQAADENRPVIELKIDHPAVDTALLNETLKRFRAEDDRNPEVSAASGGAEGGDCRISMVQPDEAAGMSSIMSLDPLWAEFHPFNDMAVDPARWQGRLIGLPLTIQPSRLVWNRDLVSQLGLPEPDSGWEGQDLVRWMENFTRASGEEEYGLLMFNRDVDTLGLLLAAQGAAPVGWESRFPRALFTDAKVVEGMRWIRKMQEVKALFPLAGGSWKQALELLADGKIAMWIAPAGEEISGFFGNQEPSFPTGISALPQFAALDESADRGRMAMFYIHANTDDMQACYRLGLYLMQHPQGLPGIPMLESLTATEDPSLMVPSPLASRDDDRRLLSRPLRGWLYDAASTDDLNEGLAQAQWKADLYRACLEQANQPDLALVVQNCQREVDSR